MQPIISAIEIPSQTGNHLSWRDLPNTTLNLSIAETAQKHTGVTLVIARNTFDAVQLQHELSFFSDHNLEITFFSDWETLPYDHFSPHQDIVSARLYTLHRLLANKSGIYIVTANTLMQHLAPPTHLDAYSLVLKKSEKINVLQLRERFIRCNYQLVEQVFKHGEFAVRGSIIDIFPMGSTVPFRIDLFDDEIDSIRLFDVDTQCSSTKVEQIKLLPAREFPFNDHAISLFRQQWRSEFEGNPANCPIYQNTSEGISSQGIEYYLPLFFDHTVSLLDYLPQNTLIIAPNSLKKELQQYWHDIDLRYQQLRHDITKPILAPEKIFFNPDIILNSLEKFSLIITATHDNTLKFLINPKSAEPLSSLNNYLKNCSKRVLFTAESLGHRENILTQLAKLKITPTLFDTWQQFTASDAKYGICIAKLYSGAEFDNIVIISEAQLTGQAPQKSRRKTTSSVEASNIIKNLTELTIGEAVVHIDHGIGKFLGLQIINNMEFVAIEYADKNKLYVPVTNLHLISRYGGMDSENIAVNKLGNDQWEKAKQKATKRVYDVAAELLELHAQRFSKSGVAFEIPQQSYAQFSANFPFELTDDQVKAIDDVLNDMRSDKAMDRLVCGDVGFGKTEVAMRAAFIAVQNGMQVGVLVPTTLLAQQHYETFKERFAESAITIEVISRFNSGKQQIQTLEKLSHGKVDIIIGTHKLLQENIRFKNLGLLIIDEEHRFGVRQKERLKSLRAEVDILTLTATPIPRTLNMALSDIRDLSIIATPPAKRLAVKTFVHSHESSVIREAILREVMRGGQVFYLHNAVKTIEQRARELQELLPEAKVVFAHGQMPESQLEKVMVDFYHQRFNVLVCTTIIENGIDVPTANTIIIERADKLGLSQLHQLRGRVGRSHHQAYAYLLTPDKNLLTADAEKRLDAISSLEDLGVGFMLATHDLEIRGAGEFLGDDQSGHIQHIGFSLYMEFLEKAVSSLKAGKKIDFNHNLIETTEVDLGIPAIIPDTYLHDVHTRLILYKRIANAENEQALDQLQIEMIDRFGLLPETAKNLFLVTEIKLRAQQLGIHKIITNKNIVTIQFNKNPNIDPLKIIHLIQKNPQQYKMDGPHKLKVILDNKADIANHLIELFDRWIEK